LPVQLSLPCQICLFWKFIEDKDNKYWRTWGWTCSQDQEAKKTKTANIIALWNEDTEKLWWELQKGTKQNNHNTGIMLQLDVRLEKSEKWGLVVYMNDIHFGNGIHEIIIYEMSNNLPSFGNCTWNRELTRIQNMK
jgi:hypothetical protein